MSLTVHVGICKKVILVRTN